TAAEYSRKVVSLVPAMKKPEGVPDDQFKTQQNNRLGMAHVTLGYVSYQKGAASHRVGPAIQEFKTAIDPLNANPSLQGQALYYLGYAYESQGNHKSASEALTRGARVSSQSQGPS